MTLLSRWLYAAIAALALPLPAAEAEPVVGAGCGYISTSAKPPLSDELYPVEIRRIDGADTRPRNRHQLAAGRHKIAVQELIGSTPRGYTKLRKLGNREVALVYKIIEIDIEANTSYQLGARLLPDKLDPAQAHAYWEPTVWRKSAEDCN